MTVLEDLTEIDSLILDLEGRDYVLSANAYEKLTRKCSHDWETFNYLQERVHDARISRWGNKIHEVIFILLSSRLAGIVASHQFISMY